jgi:hypothetical protein
MVMRVEGHAGRPDDLQHGELGRDVQARDAGAVGRQRLLELSLVLERPVEHVPDGEERRRFAGCLTQFVHKLIDVEHEVIFLLFPLDCSRQRGRP